MDGSELVGVITDRDVRSRLGPRIDTPIESAEDTKTLETKVHQVITRDLITVSPGIPIAEAASLLLKPIHILLRKKELRHGRRLKN